MLAKPQKQKLCNSATTPRILIAAGCERRLMSIKDSYLYFGLLAMAYGPGWVPGAKVMGGADYIPRHAVTDLR